MVLALTACSVSTSHLDGLKVGTDKDITTPTTSINPTDQIFASVQAANVASKVDVTFSLTPENVAGLKPNAPQPQLDKTLTVDQDQTLSYHLTPNGPKGWPPGTYKLTATMMDNGTQRDQKSVEITVGGAAAGGGGASGGGDNGASSSSDNSATSSSDNGATSSGN